MNKQVDPITRSMRPPGRRPGRGRILALALVIVLAACAPAALFAADETVPPAEKILDQYVAATGGLEAYDKVENRLIKARLDLAGQGISLDMTIYLAKPGKSYNLIESDMIGKAEKGTLGEVAWESSMMTGPRILEGNERKLARYGATLDVMAHWRDNFEKIEPAVLETVDERPCYKITLTSNEGVTQEVFFDRETGLMTKMSMVVDTPMGEVPMESFTDDYREVDGILVPHKAVIEVMGQERVMTMNSIEQNVEIPAGRFDLPDEIKALLEKTAETE